MRDLLLDETRRLLALSLDQSTAHLLVKTMQNFRDLSPLLLVERSLQVPNDLNGMVDLASATLDVGLGLRSDGPPQVFHGLLLEQDDEPYGIRSRHGRFAIRQSWIHHKPDVLMGWLELLFPLYPI